jgi:hypothetical protein
MYQKKLKHGEATCPHTARQPEQALSFLAREGSWKGFGSLWTNGGRKTDRSWLKTLCHPKCPSKSKSLSSNSRSWSSKLNDQVLRGLRPGGTYFGDRHISEGNDVRYEYNERPCLKNPNWYMLGMGVPLLGPPGDDIIINIAYMHDWSTWWLRHPVRSRLWMVTVDLMPRPSRRILVSSSAETGSARSGRWKWHQRRPKWLVPNRCHWVLNEILSMVTWPSLVSAA